MLLKRRQMIGTLLFGGKPLENLYLYYLWLMKCILTVSKKGDHASVSEKKYKSISIFISVSKKGSSAWLKSPTFTALYPFSL